MACATSRLSWPDTRRGCLDVKGGQSTLFPDSIDSIEAGKGRRGNGLDGALLLSLSRGGAGGREGGLVTRGRREG